MKLIEIITHSGKIKTIYDLVNFLDPILELVKEDVFKIAKSKRIVFSDFDFTFSCAVEILKNQLKKTHLKAIDRFFKCENIDNAINWLIERTLNNMRNISTNSKFKCFCAPSFMQINENIKSNYDYETVIELMDLKRFDSQTIMTGLKKVWSEVKYDQDFDHEDFEELCCKFGYTSNEVVGSHAFEEPKLFKYEVETGQFQLQLLF